MTDHLFAVILTSREHGTLKLILDLLQRKRMPSGVIDTPEFLQVVYAVETATPTPPRSPLNRK